MDGKRHGVIPQSAAVQEMVHEKAARKMAVAACFLSALAGCGPTKSTQTAGPTVECGIVCLTDAEKEGLMPGNGADSACISYVTWDSKPIFVVWSDAPWGGSGATSGSDGPTKPHGVLVYRGNDMKLKREIEFSGEIQSREKGEITINGETYDFAKGALFLVSDVDGDVQVKQLSRDVSTLKLEPKDLSAFGKADPEITAFFSKAAKPK